MISDRGIIFEGQLCVYMNVIAKINPKDQMVYGLLQFLDINEQYSEFINYKTYH